MNTTNDKLIQLRTMLGQAGEMHYKRIKLAKEIIEDNMWLLSKFNGDEIKAGEVLEEDYFGDLCGAINFWRLLKILEEFPKIEDWKKHNFNLTKMSAIIDAREKGSRKKTTRWSVTQRDYESLEFEKNKLRKVCEERKKELEMVNSKVQNLENLVATLTREKARLEGKVAELQVIVNNLSSSTKRSA